MTNPFDRFGIKHLSPSSLNLFQASPALWAGKYLYGWKDDAGPAAKRGTAVEAGLDVYLWERDIEKAAAVALDNFAMNTQGVAEPEYEKERALIPYMLGQAIKTLADAPTPLARQVKVEHYFDGLQVPVIGYIDYLWPDRLRDLKSTMRIPSELKGDHGRQVSLYWKVKQLPASIVYVSDKRHSELDLNEDDAQRHLWDMQRCADTLQHVLSRVEDRNDFIRFYVPDFDNFRWSEQTKQLAREMYAPF